MKKLIFTVFILAMILSVNVVHASNIIWGDPAGDPENGTITITGKILNIDSPKSIMISILPKETTFDQAVTNKSIIAYTDEFSSDPNGNFIKVIKMNPARAESGFYTVYLFGANLESPVAKDFLYTTPNDMKTIMDSLKEPTETNIANVLNKFDKNLFITPFVPYDSITDKTDLTRIIVNEMKKHSNATISAATFKELVHKMSIIELYNNGTTNGVVTANSQMIYSELLGMSSDKYYIVYSQKLNDRGRQITTEKLKNNNYTDFEQWYNAFIRFCYVQNIINAQVNGYAHVHDLFVNNEFGLNLTAYLKLSETNQDLTDSQLVSSDISTIEQLQVTLDAIVQSYTTSNVPSGPTTKGSSKSLGSKISIDSSYAASLQPEPNKLVVFSDMQSAEWANDAVESLAEKGIISGNEDGTFAPEKMVTRAEFVKMLTAALNMKDIIVEETFSDVAKSDWYFPYLIKAKAAGIISGKPDGSFGADDYITREDCAAILYRSLRALEAEKVDELQFNDKDEIADYAVEAVKALYSEKIINGMGNNLFVPKELCTRAQAAVMIYNLLKR